MPMKWPLFARAQRATSIEALYGAIVAQARSPVFYLQYGIPDTVNGRFEMIVLHLAMVLDRLASEPQSLRSIGQAAFDMFCQDMDDQLRESGVGDLAVPKKMRRVAEAFYGRQEVYHTAMSAAGAQALRDAILRNVYSGIPEASLGAERLAAYMREAVHRLAAQDAAAFAQCRLAWPDPDAIAAPR
jgi:cytochrome b pre-mRNA-processing protein 3